MRAFLLLCALLAPAVHAGTCTAVSGDTRNRLLELYTSEGCSSCPPADRWLSQLPADSGVVPLAFHVDYWDRLGWHDPYAQAAFTQRQRDRNRGSGWVYTPQVMLDGADFRAWHRGLPAPSNAPAPASLALMLSQTPERIDVRAESHAIAPATGRDAALYLALFENRLSSKVSAGENAQRTLHHDHVVRQLAGPFDPGRARHRFALQPGWKAADLGVAAFVLDAKGATLQVLTRSGCP
ncbi:MAG: DUF1223 domain-containing protein [Gammaproteobacteria bacterium]|jgi:hypothetical protein|nr:DUF1223 domain-containing protein [Gammaproteobacteria bacterium]MBU1406727.1 DUF1223 domain-containing protein [Gammaproteobacteria bacterium]MBU1533359.1 DUF1223 domain-containing protein [Gammaproteobacteria bacterium]